MAAIILNPDATPALEPSMVVTGDGFSIALYRYPGADLVLCGYSWGGYTSARFAVENPSFVSRLGLVAPGIWIPPGPRPPTASLPAESHNYGRNTRGRLLEMAGVGPDDDIALFDAFAEQAPAHNPSLPLGIDTDYLNRASGPMIDLAKLAMPVDLIFRGDDPVGGAWVHDLFRELPSPDKSLRFIPTPATGGRFKRLAAVSPRLSPTPASTNPLRRGLPTGGGNRLPGGGLRVGTGR